MTTRWDFIKTAVAAGIGSAALAQVDAAQAAAPNPVPKQMPRDVMLLSILQADGSETLGVKLPNGILDVVPAAKALGIDGPRTVEHCFPLEMPVRSNG